MTFPRIVTPDTNILVRAVIRDDEPQTRAAIKLLKDADLIALTLQALCEFAWVLDRSYKTPSSVISRAIGALVNAGNIAVDHAAVASGLAVLNAGGDFADGVVAHEGRWLGGDTFVSFDKKAVSLLKSQGLKAELLS